jgi:AraC family transcriptional regulator of adaptative response/methylated-DNA-[protein]-cysteine methyltransferase
VPPRGAPDSGRIEPAQFDVDFSVEGRARLCDGPVMQLPAQLSTDEMYGALVDRDQRYEGVFVVGVTTTGIFCRPTCPARKPKPANVEYFPDARAALLAGYRPCKRCTPLSLFGAEPDWVGELIDDIEADLETRIRDQNLRERGLDPARVRRWFQRHHQMTFHAYQRARRLGAALGQIRQGADLTDTAFASGFESLSGFRDAFEKLFGVPPGKARAQTRVVVNRLLTPLGPMIAAATEDALCLLEFVDRRMLEKQIGVVRQRLGAQFAPGDNEILARTQSQLGEYFAGQRQTFDLPMVTPGTEFQIDAWRGLLDIPYGQTRTYAEQAAHIGRPQAVRAVGRANGDNRIAILVPCHRVIGAGGKLTGYGGQLWRKQALLSLESSVQNG